MLFNSLHFLVFFPVIVLLYFNTPQKYRWILLLTGSYYFYMSWKAEYVILLLISTLINYVAAIQISKSRAASRRRLFLAIGVVSNLLMLIAFKYFNFFSDSFRTVLQQFSIPLQPWTLKVLLPVGISFFTFQTMSYTIDVYRRSIKPQRHLGIFALYVSFFPQLVAGPIERAKNLLPQFFEKHRFEYARAASGLTLMLWGFFKKIVIADGLAMVVNVIYNDASSYTGTLLIIATVFFAFQIYCDFSGYTDIAIGAAQVMGFRLSENFRRPFFSKNISEFWRRWHISLSTWFQDYVFNPLYLWFSKMKLFASLRTEWRHTVVFVVTIILGEALLGLWHGANWTFVLFGIYHGAMISAYYLTRNIWNRMYVAVQLALNFIIILIGFVLFRANTVSDAVYVLTHLHRGITFSTFGLSLDIGIGFIGLFIAIASILLLLLVDLLDEHKGAMRVFAECPKTIRWTVYIVLVLAIVFLGQSSQQFIYFQF